MTLFQPVAAKEGVNSFSVISFKQRQYLKEISYSELKHKDAKHRDAKIFENYLNPVMLLFIR